MNERRTLWICLGALTVLRLVFVGFLMPSPQEAYYFLCAHHPAAAYYDGPPGTAWLVRVLAGLGGGDFLWRSSAPIWALVASLACFGLVRRLTNERSALASALILNALPIFNQEAVRVGPELPALAFGILALLGAWTAFEAEKRTLVWWLASGVLAGLAALFHYAAIIVVPAMWLFVLCSARHRQARDVLGLVIFGALPILMLVPALQWNDSKDWLPIAGGTLQTLWNFKLAGFGFSLVWALYFISPLVFAGLLVAWVESGANMRLHVRPRFVFLAAMPGILLGIYFLLRGENGVFYFLLAVPVLLFKALEFGASVWVVRAAVGCAVALSLPIFPWAWIQGDFWARAATEYRAVFLEKLAEGQDSLFLIGEDESIASIMGYYLRNDLIPPDGHPIVYVRESQAVTSQFGLWASYDDFVESEHVGDEYFTEQKGENPFVGRSALYVTTEPQSDLPQSIRGAFESVTLIRTFPAGGLAQEPLYIFLCLNYQTMPL